MKTERKRDEIMKGWLDTDLKIMAGHDKEQEWDDTDGIEDAEDDVEYGNQGENGIESIDTDDGSDSDDAPQAISTATAKAENKRINAEKERCLTYITFTSNGADGWPFDAKSVFGQHSVARTELQHPRQHRQRRVLLPLLLYHPSSPLPNDELKLPPRCLL